MLKKALTTIGLATVLLTSSISANELATQGFSNSTDKIEMIGAFSNIPTESLNSQEINEKGEYFNSLWFTPTGQIYTAYHEYQRVKRDYQYMYWYGFSY